MKIIKPFQYFGGKSYMQRDIVKFIAPIHHKVLCWVDVFGGSGTFILNLPAEWITRKTVLVWNDIDKRLYTFFKVLQDDAKREELLKKLAWAFPHRAVFEEFKNSDWDALDDVEVAFRFLYLVQLSFSGDLTTYSVHVKEYRDRLHYAGSKIKETVQRLKRVNLESLDFRDLIKKYDSPTTFFYLDPPYLKGGKKYEFSFTEEDFRDLKEILDNVKGYWLMNESGIDFDKIIEIFGKPKAIKEYTNHGINARATGKKTKRREGFWANFGGDEKCKRKN